MVLHATDPSRPASLMTRADAKKNAFTARALTIIRVLKAISTPIEVAAYLMGSLASPHPPLVYWFNVLTTVLVIVIRNDKVALSIGSAMNIVFLYQSLFSTPGIGGFAVYHPTMITLFMAVMAGLYSSIFFLAGFAAVTAIAVFYLHFGVIGSAPISVFGMTAYGWVISVVFVGYLYVISLSCCQFVIADAVVCLCALQSSLCVRCVA